MVFHTTNDLFRLLDANPSLLHNYNPSAAASPAAPSHSRTPSTASRRAFSPNFDVIETPAAYVLEGELPGLSNKAHVSLEFTESQTLLVRGKIERTPVGSGDEQQQKQPKRLKPTVEDAGEDGDVADEKIIEEEQRREDERRKTRYWVSERTVGEFQRTFSFPGYVDVDAVEAKLEHGILRIVVPKKSKPEGRKIEIM